MLPFRPSPSLLEMAICNMRVLDVEEVPVCVEQPFHFPSHVSHKYPDSFAYGAPFSVQLRADQSSEEDIDGIIGPDDTSLQPH